MQRAYGFFVRESFSFAGGPLSIVLAARFSKEASQDTTQ